LLAVAVCTGALAFAFGRIPALSVPRFGLRGKRRAEARSEPLFRALEIPLRHVGKLMARSNIPRARASFEALAVRSGQPWGLCADEWLALSLSSGLVLGLGGAWLTRDAQMDVPWTIGAPVLSLLWPWSRLQQLAKARARELERSLPNAIDLCVLCMGAGADFTSALRFVVAELGGAHPVCQEELAQVLDEMNLGRTRVEALTALAERTGSRAVQDFVGAVCQSEVKGTPLVNALDIQAGALRQRRSVLAEEAAAAAQVRLMLPMMLLVVCVVLIVIGPFIVTGAGL